MINDKEIALWIARLETEESSWANYEKLAALYTIRAHQDVVDPASQISGYSAAAAPIVEHSGVVGDYGDSEFLQAVASCPASGIWRIMDELMDTLQVVNPRAYNSVMRKILDL